MTAQLPIMRAALPFWQLATPWTPEQWAGIVAIAKRVRELRKQARAARARAAFICDGTHHLTLEWRARNLEQHLRYFADVRLKDISDANLDAYINSLTTKETT